MKNIHSENFKIGMLGGGQLGRMTLQEAYNLNLHIDILDPSENAPCKSLANKFTCGDFKDFETVYNFGKDKDVITIEFEDVNAEALEKLENEGVKVFPQSRVIRLIQDKGLQKEFYQSNGIPTAAFVLINKKEKLNKYSDQLPFVQKMRTGGYDGKGVALLKESSAFENAFDGPSLIEDQIDFEKELSVIVARNEQGESSAFPVVECQFNKELNLVEFLFSPADIPPDTESEAVKLAQEVIEKLDMVGLLAVELFLTKKGELYVNEVAPRTHNSGHHTIECNYTSQFEQHLRAILGLPLGSTSTKIPGVMVNLLGSEKHTGTAVYDGIEQVVGMEGVYLHLYGKSETKPNRKMGHATITNSNLEKAKEKAKEVQGKIRIVSI